MADARYAGTPLDTMGDDKLQSTSRLEMTQGGSSRSGPSGPTGSSRSYPKGSSVPLKPTKPMTGDNPTYGVGGV